MCWFKTRVCKIGKETQSSLDSTFGWGLHHSHLQKQAADQTHAKTISFVPSVCIFSVFSLPPPSLTSYNVLIHIQ